MLKSKTTVTSQAWSLELRVSVGDCVSHDGRDWVSVNGINTEPGFNSSNWEVVSPIKRAPRPVVDVFGYPFTLIKHIDNTDPTMAETIENNDMIVNGWQDNDMFWPMAICIDEANPDLEASWNAINPIEEITLL